MIQALFKRSGIYFGGLVFSKVLTTILFILLARLLQPDGFGQLTLFLTLLTLITVVSDAGLNQWYQKYTSDDSVVHNLHTIIGIRTYLYFISIFFVGIALYVWSIFPVAVIGLFVVTLFFESYLSVLDGYYLYTQQPLKIAGKQLLRALVLLVYVLFFAFTSSVEFILVIYLVATIVATIYYLPFKQLVGFSWTSFKTFTATLLQSSSYLILIATSFFYARGDAFIIRYFLNDGALGLYGAAYRYLEGAAMLPTALAQNLFPLAAKSGHLIKSQALLIIGIMTSLGGFAGLALWLASPILITLLLGSSYNSAIPILQVFAVVLTLFFINSPLSTFVQSSGKIKDFLPFGISNTIANLILNAILIPQYGLIGSAYAMVLSEISGMIINIYFFSKVYQDD